MSRSFKSFTAIAALSAFALAACETTPEPVVEPVAATKMEDMAVEIYTPPEPVREAVPSIDIAEYERQQAEKAAALKAAEDAAKPKPAPKPKPVVKKTLEQRLASARTPDRKIAILNAEPESAETMKLIKSAYEAKLASDKASGDNEGAASALVYLGQLDAKGGSRESDMAALSKYAEALKLNADNAEAPRLVSQIRGKLQGYSDSLHKEAVSYFVKQDFAPAVSRWEKVLLIDPGNTAARNWYNQATDALNR